MEEKGRMCGRKNIWPQDAGELHSGRFVEMNHEWTTIDTMFGTVCARARLGGATFTLVWL